MDVKKLLDYQSFDVELRKLEVELEKSEDYIRQKKAQDNFNNAKTAVKNINAEAESLISYYNKAKAFYTESEKRIQEIEQRIEAGSDAEKYKQSLSNVMEMITKIEKDIFSLLRRIDRMKDAYIDANKKGTEAKKEYSEAKAGFENLQQEKSPEMQKLTAKLADLEKGIEPHLMQRYKSLRKDKVMPALVPLYKSDRCGGCRMEMAVNSINKLKEEGAIECESCRRIIYNE